MTLEESTSLVLSNCLFSDDINVWQAQQENSGLII
jgi:hypothetical protein